MHTTRFVAPLIIVAAAIIAGCSPHPEPPVQTIPSMCLIRDAFGVIREVPCDA